MPGSDVCQDGCGDEDVQQYSSNLDPAQQAEYARSLGADVERETELLQYIVEMLALPMPPPWREYLDPERRIYYYNSLTGESSWVHPLHTSHVSMTALFRRVIASGDRLTFACAELSALRAQGEVEMLNWREAMAVDGSPYYYHVETQETRWDDPREDLRRDLTIQVNLLASIVERTAIAAAADGGASLPAEFAGTAAHLAQALNHDADSAMESSGDLNSNSRSGSSILSTNEKVFANATGQSLVDLTNEAEATLELEKQRVAEEMAALQREKERQELIKVALKREMEQQELEKAALLREKQQQMEEQKAALDREKQRQQDEEAALELQRQRCEEEKALLERERERHEEEKEALRCERARRAQEERAAQLREAEERTRAARQAVARREAEASAASRLQVAWRRRKARREAVLERERMQREREQEATRLREAEEKMYAARRELQQRFEQANAATQLQAAWRGKLARQNVAVRRRELARHEEEKAARIREAEDRMFAARAALARRVKEADAASSIQAGWRAHVARQVAVQELERRRREKKQKDAQELEILQREIQENAAKEVERLRREEEENAAKELERLRREEEEKAAQEREKLRREEAEKAAQELEKLRREEEEKAAQEHERLQREEEAKSARELERLRREDEEKASQELERVRREEAEKAAQELERQRREEAEKEANLRAAEERMMAARRAIAQRVEEANAASVVQAAWRCRAARQEARREVAALREKRRKEEVAALHERRQKEAEEEEAAALRERRRMEEEVAALHERRRQNREEEEAAALREKRRQEEEEENAAASRERKRKEEEEEVVATLREKERLRMEEEKKAALRARQRSEEEKEDEDEVQPKVLREKQHTDEALSRRASPVPRAADRPRRQSSRGLDDGLQSGGDNVAATTDQIAGSGTTKMRRPEVLVTAGGAEQFVGSLAGAADSFDQLLEARRPPRFSSGKPQADRAANTRRDESAVDSGKTNGKRLEADESALTVDSLRQTRQKLRVPEINGAREAGGGRGESASLRAGLPSFTAVQQIAAPAPFCHICGQYYDTDDDTFCRCGAKRAGARPTEVPDPSPRERLASQPAPASVPSPARVVSRGHGGHKGEVSSNRSSSSSSSISSSRSSGSSSSSSSGSSSSSTASSSSSARGSRSYGRCHRRHASSSSGSSHSSSSASKASPTAGRRARTGRKKRSKHQPQRDRGWLVSVAAAPATAEANRRPRDRGDVHSAVSHRRVEETRCRRVRRRPGEEHAVGAEAELEASLELVDEAVRVEAGPELSPEGRRSDRNGSRGVGARRPGGGGDGGDRLRGGRLGSRGCSKPPMLGARNVSVDQSDIDRASASSLPPSPSVASVPRRPSQALSRQGSASVGSNRHPVRSALPKVFEAYTHVPGNAVLQRRRAQAFPTAPPKQRRDPLPVVPGAVPRDGSSVGAVSVGSKSPTCNGDGATGDGPRGRALSHRRGGASACRGGSRRSASPSCPPLPSPDPSPGRAAVLAQAGSKVRAKGLLRAAAAVAPLVQRSCPSLPSVH
eukprot:TRINITY_DN6564_c0_g1_i1.p1 TRINITY_DN6564_c0_g1~~TRINITY_DN6564_c0_g1_i1.p1  ORF type:complete len:1534 (+),score=421.01 TRINITY_DN6564_c0_g1_i1:30-4604(+)